MDKETTTSGVSPLKLKLDPKFQAKKQKNKVYTLH